MKRIFSLLFAVCMLFAVVGCAESKEIEQENPQEELFRLVREEFQGKNVVIYGDSITVETSKSLWIEEGGKNWVDYLQSALGFNKLGNFAASGTFLTHSMSNVPAGSAIEDRLSGVHYIAQHAAENARADYAFIAYGTNDFAASTPMGTAEDDFSSYVEADTFCGSVRLAVETLREQNPDIQILFLTPIFRSNWSKLNPENGVGFSLREYCQAILDMSEALEYRAVNMYDDIFGWDNYIAGEGLTPDGLHPNGMGHRMMAMYLLDLDAQSE